jgi:hypothetical protein
MSRSARIRRFFGDDEYEFRLGIGEAETLDEETGCGLMQLLERLPLMHVADMRAILRNGLIGGGMKRQDAFGLVKRHLVEGYLVEASDVATAVLIACIRGVPEDPPDIGVGEQPGEQTSPSRSPTAESVSA